MKKTISLFVFLIANVLFAGSAVADADKKEALKEMTALMINLNGHPCAAVIDITPMRMKDTYEVTCIANRGGKARKTYVFNPAKGTASEL